MKELTIEQKAKAYDEAVENMRKFRDALNNHEELDLWVLKKEIVKDIDYYFPELKESEDEKMWKLIKKYAHYNISDMALDADHITREQLESWLEKQGEQKSAWSEEDALRLEEAIYMIKARGWIRGDDAVKLVLDWLKSLKDRVSPQPKQEWSEVDEYTLNETIQHLKELIEIDKTKHCACDVQYYQRDIDWLKSLKQRIGG